MFENIGGIKRAEPGFKKIVIQPMLTDQLNWAKTSYESIHGRIAVEWEQEKGNVLLKVEIPPNTTATIHVPGQSDPVNVGSGNYTFKGSYTAQ